MRPTEGLGSGLRRLGVLLAWALLCVGCGDEDVPHAPVPIRSAYAADGASLRTVGHADPAPNLLVVVFDALRHDALPVKDGLPSDARMRQLASLAAQGITFENAVAPAPWTLPSMTSLLTGLQPSAHGLSVPESRVRLVDAITTWAEILRNAYGYDTVAMTAGPWFLGSGRSILQGFSTLHQEFSLRDVGGSLRRWARCRNRKRPFFLLLHTYDVHDPYGEHNHPWPGGRLPAVTSDPTLVGPSADPAEIFRRCFLDAGYGLALRDALGRSALTGRLHRYAHSGYAADPRPEVAAELETAYWGGVRWADGLLANARRMLAREGLLDNTLLVVTSDHGEGFGEHGSLGHGRMLYDELVRIPMVMVGPEPFRGGRVVTGSIGLVDVVPTFFEWAGLEAHTGIEGRSRLSLLELDDSCRPVLSEERLGFLNTGESVDAIRLSARTEQWKYVVTYDLGTGAAHEEVYDLLLDPDEVDDLGAGSGRIPPELVFDDCFCGAVETLRRRIWDDATTGAEDASHIPYGTSNLQPSTPAPVPCTGHP